MEFTRCLRCMKEAASYPCPHCGYAPGKVPAQPHALRPGTILNGKYVVGTILGQGGFGITYIGWDLALESKVAIKEYFPSGQVVRSPENSLTLQWYTTPQAEAARNAGREMFLKEARKMSRVGSIPQVVRVRDLFQENNTAYIVMDFVEGQTLMARLKKTGPLSWEQAQSIFLPAIRAMEQVHQEGLIHRDLSPDNLMLLPSGDVRILDLGAAKDLTINSGASSMQVAKGGFSPLEQYTQRGGSGTWSDVYAMAATIYYSLTGVLPPASVDRVETDTIRWDLPVLTALPKPVLDALKKAMAVFVKDRTQTMGEFLTQLEKASAKQKSAPKQKAKKKKSPLPAIAAVLVVALVAGCVLYPREASEPQLESQLHTEAIFPLSIQEQTISAGNSYTAAIKSNGDVLGRPSSSYDITSWKDIVAISTGAEHIVGLQSDGTVVAAGSNTYHQCNIFLWKDIVSVSAGYVHTVGLKKDGTVVAAGNNSSSQCEISRWKNIVSISAGYAHTVGLKSDGTVVAAGNNAYGQCDVSNWKDIVAISAGGWHTIGLKSDGTVVATGRNDCNQCNVSDWKDIVAISSGQNHTVALKADGTVVAAGNDIAIRCNVFSNWKNIIAISSGCTHTIGLTALGTVVTAGSGQSNISDWTDIRIPGTTE